MTTAARHFLRNEAGATSIEYGMIAMLISVAIVAIVGAIGTNLTGIFTTVNSGLAH